MASVYDRTDIYDLFDSPKKDAQTLSHWQAVFNGRPIRSALDVSIGTGSRAAAKRRTSVASPSTCGRAISAT